MNRLTDNKIVLVKRKTRFEELIARHNTVEQARFYIAHLGGDITDYIEEDRQYQKVIRQASETLSALGRVQLLDRDHVPNFIFGAEDVVVSVGQDGLAANTLKYLDSQPLIGVNPDPARWDGVLLPFVVGDLQSVVRDVFRGKRPVKEVTMAKASLSDGQQLYAVNDLFIGRRTHVSARYQIQYKGRQENQSSSGIIISTGLGSTGWMKSILAGARAIWGSAGAEALANLPPLGSQSQQGSELTPGGSRNDGRNAWSADSLQFAVREPFPSRSTGTDLVFGSITRKEPVKVLSHMPESGVIFSDGMEEDYLAFSSGVTATVSLAEKKGRVVV